MSKITPEFNKKMPKDNLEYFDVASDYLFKQQHPIAYGILVFLGISALIVPIVTYLVFVIAVFPAPNSPLILLGFVGAFIFGIGLFNIIAAWIHQYLGHLVTILSFLIGIVLIIISCVLLYAK